MALGVNSFLMCLFVGLLSCSHGLEFTLDSTPDTFYCGHLNCSVDVNQNDPRILSVVGLTISSIVQSNTLIKIASVSVFDPDPQVEPTKVNDLNATGSVSRYHGNLNLSLRNETDCLMTSFVCQMDFVNVSGQPDNIREAVTPVDTTNCDATADIAKQVANVSDQLQKHSDDVDRKLTNMDGKLADVNSMLSELKTQNIDINLTLSDVEGKLTDVEGKMTDVDDKLTDIKSQNIATEQELLKLKDQNVAMETKLDSMLGYLSRLEVMINSSQHSENTFSCIRGAPHNESRVKFLMWGRVPALCDTETDRGGWVIIQRRTKGDVDFYREWYDYKNGFGSPDTDYWLGNDNIYNLSTQGYTNLRVDLEYQGVKYFAEYSSFSMADEISKYKLTVGGYHGNATDQLNYNSGMFFTTFDRDNDGYTSGNCAVYQYHGSWWYNYCSYSNLNGMWGAQDSTGLYWEGVVYPGSVTSSEMKVRQV